MSSPDPKLQLSGLLRQLGVRTHQDRGSEGPYGFPLSVPLRDGSVISLDLDLPWPLAGMDTSHIGCVVLDPLGYVRTSWGLGKRIPYFQGRKTILQTPVAGLLESGMGGGNTALYLDGYRYFSAPFRIQESSSGASESANADGYEVTDVFVLVVNAQDERLAKLQASRSERFANALKRLGKVLAMNQSIEQICVAAAHEIASATELAAVALWTPLESGAFKLTANIGINRQGAAAIDEILPESGASCVAELVGSTREPLFLESVSEHIMTANLEAMFCYLRPGGLSVHPLVNSGRLLGILELIGKEGDELFAEHKELFETFAEHLSLALNAATMFETAEKRASHDALTGIANHRTMQEFLVRRVAEAKRTQGEIGVIMLDVDHFRSFNEEEGHDAGDEVLRMVADALKVCTRPYDLPARYGGEEFSVIMPGSGRESTLYVAERIRQKIESSPFITSSGRERLVTVSIGTACHPETAEEPKQLLKAADVAMFTAKRGGRNRVQHFEGVFHPLAVTEGTQEVPIDSWIDGALRERSAQLLVNVRDEIDLLAARLPLSENQVAILEALLLIAPSYRWATEHEDRERLGQMELASEFRVLLPSLHVLDERFDGLGPKELGGNQLPLLARVLHVLLALEEEGGQPLLTDPTRFDPEILRLLAELRSAA